MTAASALETDWSRDYTAFMRCDAGDDWMPDVQQQVSAWLREKGFDVDLSTPGDYTESGRRLSVRNLEGGGVRDLRVNLVEQDAATGVWTTLLLAHDEPGSEDWISLTVTNDQGRFVSVPRLARYLMQVLPLGDGTIEFTDQPQMFRTHDVDRLVDLLADGERHGLVFVAGSSATDDVPVDRFAAKVGAWTREVYGLAQVVVLDPAATQAFEQRVGGRFHAPAWTIRTYLPGAAFGDPFDARRHRILGTERLSTQPDGRIRGLLGDIARNHAADRALPNAVRRVRRRFDRTENQQLIEAFEVVPAPTVEEALPAVEVASPESHPRPMDKVREQVGQLALVKRILGIEDFTESHLRQLAQRLSHRVPDRDVVKRFEARVYELQSRVEQFEDFNRELRTTLEDEQMGRELAMIDVDDRDARIRWLESRLKDDGDYEIDYLAVPDAFVDDRPSSFGDLLGRIETLPGVAFTGDVGEVLTLELVDTNGSALRTAWDAVLTLVDYVRARSEGEWEQGLDQYIQAQPAGYRNIAPGKFAPSETSATMDAYGSERVFPVPTTAYASGRAEMSAHFKLAKIGMVSPRMHVLDRHPTNPIVYIGYIGRHLTNTQTN